MRIPQPAGAKGSLRWIQRVADPDSVVSKAVGVALGLPDSAAIDWRSPRSDDEYAEYRDGDFLTRVKLERLRADLKAYWPTRGPQWDALGVTSDGKVILVEAKAHVRELASTCAAGPTSLARITRALDGAKRYYGASEERDWLHGYYQYANRLAHLQFLRERGVDAHLAFIYFLGDAEVGGPESEGAWAETIHDCHAALGIPTDRSVPGVHEIFVRCT